jgi:hypothetical protein
MSCEVERASGEVYEQLGVFVLCSPLHLLRTLLAIKMRF